MINQAAVDKLKPGVMLVNTSRGALIDTDACARGRHHIICGHIGLDNTFYHYYHPLTPLCWLTRVEAHSLIPMLAQEVDITCGQ